MSPHLKCRKDINGSKRRTKRATKKLKLRLAHFNVALVLVVVFMLGVYLVQLADSTTKGFAMREVDTTLSETQRLTRELESQINDYKSVDYVAKAAEDLGMVLPSDVDYLSPISSGFAVR